MVINLALFVWVASKFEYKALEKKLVSMPKAPGRGVVPRWVRPQIVSGGPVRFVQYPQYQSNFCAPPPPPPLLPLNERRTPELHLLRHPSAIALRFQDMSSTPWPDLGDCSTSRPNPDGISSMVRLIVGMVGLTITYRLQGHVPRSGGINIARGQSMHPEEDVGIYGRSLAFQGQQPAFPLR